MKFRLPILGAALALGMAVFSMAPAFASSQTATSSVLTTAAWGSNANGSFVGTFTLTHVFTQNHQLFASGVLSGTATNALTGAKTAVSQTVTAPLAVDPTCTILTLNVGAIHLDLLGLVVDTSPINLNITAQSGPGQLLGNLLCAVANLLNNTGTTSGALTALLNNIIGILNGL